MRGQIKGMGAKQRYFVDGYEVSQEEFRQAFPDRPIGNGEGLTAWHRPIESESLAVHSSQIKEAIERNRRHGVHIEYLPDGRPVFLDRGQRRDLLKIEREVGGLPNCHDRDGGYGDG